MNRLGGDITKIEVNGSLSLVTVKISEELTLKSIVIETPETADYLKIGTPVKVIFKETEVVVGSKADHAISLQNRFKGVIGKIEKGALISKVVMETGVGEIAAVISTNAVETLSLKIGSEVVGMVKLNEIMLAE